MGLRGRVSRSVIKRESKFLLLGAIVSVAVACGCAGFMAVGIGNSLPVLASEHPPRWRFRIYERWGATRISSEVHREEMAGDPACFVVRKDLIPRWSRLNTPPTKAEATSPFSDIVIEDARGWPLVSMKSTVMRIVKGKAQFGGISLPHNHRYPDVFRSIRALPTEPLWIGFALNALFYSVAPRVLYRAPFALRGWLRLRRGQCPVCAYPIGVSPVCTECGKPVIKRKAETHEAETA